MRLALFVFAGVASAQVQQLATSGDGGTLLFRSNFRLPSETDLGSQGKIYRWQNGTLSRLAAAGESNGISPPDVFDPFLSSDGTIAGWQINVGCLLCQITVAPPQTSAVTGVTLPAGFPRSEIRMSANGRYFTADSYPFSGPKYLDSSTGAISDVPVDQFARPITRAIANDGTVLLLITPPQDPGQDTKPGRLALWKPGADPRVLYSDNRVSDATISAAGNRVAFEAVVEGGPNDDQRTLVVLDTQTGEQIPVAAMPSKDFRALFESLSKPVWDLTGTLLLYRSYDDQGQPSALSLWDSGSRSSRVILTNTEGFASAVLSGDGRVVWAVTSVNRLLRLDVSSGSTEEILPPLGSITRLDGDGVAGSAFLLHGQGFSDDQVPFDNGNAIPRIGVASDGMWVQIPFEDSATSHTLTIRGASPFEAVVKIQVSAMPEPLIATTGDSIAGTAFAIAPHQDFSDLVSPANPARRGETVHVYMTGLGPLDRAVATGAPGPSPAARPVTPMVCRIGDPLMVMAMPFLGYAVGLVGIYQADLTIPETVAAGNARVLCTINISTGTRSGSALIPVR
jgi:uncharacterized protein (TIGR03437 family)